MTGGDRAAAARHGRSLTAGDVIFTPAADLQRRRPASPTRVTRQRHHQRRRRSETGTGTVNLTVTEVNDAPSAATTRAARWPRTARGVPGGWSGANDSKGPANEAGQTLTVTAVTATRQHGTVSLTARRCHLHAGRRLTTARPASPTRSATTAPPTAPPIRRRDTARSASPSPRSTTRRSRTTTAPTVAEDDASGVASIDVLGNDTTGPANECGQTLTDHRVSTPGDGTVAIVGDQITLHADRRQLQRPRQLHLHGAGQRHHQRRRRLQVGHGHGHVTVTEVNDAPSADDDSADRWPRTARWCSPAAGLRRQRQQGPGQRVRPDADRHRGRPRRRHARHGVARRPAMSPTRRRPTYNGAGQLRLHGHRRRHHQRRRRSEDRHRHRQRHRHRGQRRGRGGRRQRCRGRGRLQWRRDRRARR